MRMTREDELAINRKRVKKVMYRNECIDNRICPLCGPPQGVLFKFKPHKDKEKGGTEYFSCLIPKCFFTYKREV